MKFRILGICLNEIQTLDKKVLLTLCRLIFVFKYTIATEKKLVSRLTLKKIFFLINKQILSAFSGWLLPSLFFIYKMSHLSKGTDWIFLEKIKNIKYIPHIQFQYGVKSNQTDHIRYLPLYFYVCFSLVSLCHYGILYL